MLEVTAISFVVTVHTLGIRVLNTEELNVQKHGKQGSLSTASTGKAVDQAMRLKIDR